VLLDLFKGQLADYRQNTEAAEKLLGVGAFKAKPELDRVRTRRVDHDGQLAVEPGRDDYEELIWTRFEKNSC
jgi:hypothetical protein